MLLAALVCISIVTAREHWFIDVPAGIILGLGFGWIWRRFAQNSLPDEIDHDKFAAETRVIQETR